LCTVKSPSCGNDDISVIAIGGLALHPFDDPIKSCHVYALGIGEFGFHQALQGSAVLAGDTGGGIN
jgi:hypothetical protein